LLHEGRLRLGEDAVEVVGAERVQLHADRKTALELRDQVRRFGNVKSAGRDKEDVFGLHHAVLGVDQGPLDDR
jgi:hypothetical protein